ncbi:MAG: alpha/beta hydrolase [Bacteroidota bacterium]
MKKLNLGKLTFSYLDSGKETDELVILLHGFPETSFMYHDLIEGISAKGFYCVAPNMRGYSSGARPSGRKHYTRDKLTQDVIDIAQELGKEKFHLVGHDWGAAIGWQVVHDYPDRILSWTALSVPHTQSFFEAILNDKDQQKKSEYIKMFQFPFLPEMKIRSKNYKLLRKLWYAQSEEEVEDYLAVIKEKGALTAMLNYYRANYKALKRADQETILGDIQVPTLFLWGSKDIAVGKVAVENGHRFMKGDYKFLELDAGHWLVQEKYDEVKEAIIQHLKTHKRV